MIFLSTELLNRSESNLSQRRHHSHLSETRGNPKEVANLHPLEPPFANSNQFQTLLLNSVWLFPFLQVGNSNTQDYMELLPLLGTSPLREGEFPSLRQWNMLAGSRMPVRLSIGHYRAGTPLDVWRFVASTPIFSIPDKWRV